MRFSEAYKVRSSLLVGCGPVCIVYARGLNPRSVALRAPRLDSHHDHVLGAAVFDPALHGVASIAPRSSCLEPSRTPK